MREYIRKRYEIGLEAEALGVRSATRTTAEKYRLNAITVRQCREFAREYKRSEVEALCNLERPGGVPLHWGHVTCLLTIRDREVRRRYARRAAEEGWTSPQLNARILARYRKPSSGHGRTMATPATPALGLRQMIDEGEFWLRRCEAVMGAVRAARSRRPGPKTRDLVRKAAQLLRKVQKQAGSLADELRAVVASR